MRTRILVIVAAALAVIFGAYLLSGGADSRPLAPGPIEPKPLFGQQRTPSDTPDDSATGSIDPGIEVPFESDDLPNRTVDTPQEPVPMPTAGSAGSPRGPQSA